MYAQRVRNPQKAASVPPPNEVLQKLVECVPHQQQRCSLITQPFEVKFRTDEEGSPARMHVLLAAGQGDPELRKAEQLTHKNNAARRKGYAQVQGPRVPALRAGSGWRRHP